MDDTAMVAYQGAPRSLGVRQGVLIVTRSSASCRAAPSWPRGGNTLLPLIVVS